MSDIIFDIDGTLADATHRLHLIVPPKGDPTPFTKDWDTFLSEDQVSRDAPMPQTWMVLQSLLRDGHHVLFITGRPEHQRASTWAWLTEVDCDVRWFMEPYVTSHLVRPDWLYMRTNGDRRPSSTVKEELLHQTRADGHDPKIVFEDRKDDTFMWRENGLLCCQVAEGNY